MSGDRCAMCFSPVDSVHLIALLTAEAYYTRFAATYPFLSIYNRTLHGIPPPCGFEVVPNYASVYVRRQICSGEQSLNVCFFAFYSTYRKKRSVNC